MEPITFKTLLCAAALAILVERAAVSLGAGPATPSAGIGNSDRGPATTKSTELPDPRRGHDGPVRLMLPWNAPLDIPQVELDFVKPSAQGGLQPMVIPDAVLVVRTDGGSNSIYNVRGSGLRVAFGKDYNPPQLEWGKSYYVKLADQSESAVFDVPTLKVGEIHRVQVVFGHGRTIKGAIEGSIAATLKPASQGGWSDYVAMYAWQKMPADGERVWEGGLQIRISPSGTFAVGAAPLGGELAIIRPNSMCRAYVGRVQKSELALPEAATLLPDEAKLVKRTYKFSSDHRNTSPACNDIR